MQRDNDLPIGVVAAVRIAHEKAGIEGGNEALCRIGLDRCGVRIRASTRDRATGVQRRLQELRVHPGDADNEARVDRIGTQVRLIDGRQPIDLSTDRVPDSFARDRRAGERPDCWRYRQVGRELS